MSTPDTAAVRDAVRAAGSHEFRLSVATAKEFPAIEAFSRRANPSEVTWPLTTSLINWFVHDNPCGPGFVVIARERDTDDLIGHFVFYRWMLTRRQASGSTANVPAMLYVRLYVKPEYRRRGVFAAMTKFGLELVEQCGITLAYTAPNPRSAPGFVKFGMAQRGPLPFWVRPPIPGWGLVGRLGPRSAGVDVERREAFDDAFELMISGELPATVVAWSPRSATQLNWRYTQRPDCDYAIRYLRHHGQPVGYLVTRRLQIKGRPALVICDAWVRRDHTAALRAGVEAAREGAGRGEVTIAIGGSAVPDLARAYRRAGLIRTPAVALPQPVLLLGGGVGPGSRADDLPRLEIWHVTPYDWDVF